MKKYTFSMLILIGLSLLSFTNPPSEVIQKLKGNLEKWLENYPQEKIYLQTDKPFYAPREDIWFKVYLMNAAYHLPQKMSTVVYVELIGPDKKVIETMNVEIKEGSGTGDFELEKDIPEGEYLIRAYTTYMRNYGEDWFYTKPIYVYNLGDEDLSFYENPTKKKLKKKEQELIDNQPLIDVQFFPEGGDLVENMTSKVAVKAVDKEGESIQISGKVMDQNGQVAGNFRTFTHGLGLFNFKPKRGFSYSTQIDGHEDEIIAFPEVLESGYTLQIKQTKNDSIQIRAKASAGLSFDGLTILGHIRGELFCQIQGNANVNGILAKIPKQELADGIAHFTLFDKLGRPQCERLIFIENPVNQSSATLTFGKESYKDRDKVVLDISTQTATGEAIQADCLISITDTDQVYRSPNAENIKSWFLLNSDLRGSVENPGYYFVDNDPKRKRVLDLLMMTQGWRRFSWKDLANDKFPEINYTVETGFMFSGHVSKYDNPDKPVGAKVVFSVLKGEFVMQEFNTDENGRFVFGGFHFEDTTNILFQARIPKKEKPGKQVNNSLLSGKKHVSINLDDHGSPDFSTILPIFYSKPEETIVQDFKDERYKIGVVEMNYDLRMVELGEVVVRARHSRNKDPYYRPYKAHKNQAHRITIDSIPGGATHTNLLNLLKAYVPGLRVQGTFPDQEVFVNARDVGTNPVGAEILVDGMPTPLNFVINMPPHQVHYVDILNGRQAAVYSGSGSGVIAIYTKSGAGMPVQSANRGRLNHICNGYYQTREFFSPVYDKPSSPEDRPDFRTTLFWEPNITTDENGKAQIEFYTCDNKTTYEVLIEGMTYEGIPIRKLEQFKVDF